MSELADSKALYQATCATNSEPYALQNIGDMMSPEFSENCIIIVDPSMQIHHKAFVIIDFKDDEKFITCKFEHQNNQLTKNEEFILPGLKGEMDTVTYPIHFIDFETNQNCIPLHENMRPYENIIFQWSCHTIKEPVFIFSIKIDRGLMGYVAKPYSSLVLCVYL